MFSVANEYVRLAVDEQGRLCELTNLNTNHNYAGQEGLWRLIYQDQDALENQILAKDCVPVIDCKKDCLTLRYSQHGPQTSFELIITAQLHHDEVRWSLELANRGPDTVIREIHFPIIGACQIKTGQELIWSHNGGARVTDLRQKIRKSHTLYMSNDNEGIRLSGLYPMSLATNSFVLADGEEGLYFGSHDSTFQQTIHLFELKQNDLAAGFVKYPFLSPGQKTRIEGYVTSPYSGSWHVAANKYRTWADTWYRPVEKPHNIKLMKGWQRVILKHQYGETFYKYNQLKQIHDEGAAAGIECLLLKGWPRHGFDNGYPDYATDEKQGGDAALKENIGQFRQAGGQVFLYFNGHLIDRASEFYRGPGAAISEKDFQGNEYQEFYSFGGRGTALRQFGHKTFVAACPSQPEWLTQLKKMADQAMSLQCDGVFYDQMGAWDNAQCCDPHHGHPIPFTTIGKAKADLLAALREYIKSRNPNVSFGTELLVDITAAHVDYVHNAWGACPEPETIPADGSVPPIAGFIEWFRYIFPDVIISDREIRDDTDIERRVNHALLKGLRSDVEIFRCRRTIAATPHYREYLACANKLRGKYAELLLCGRYRDTDGLTLSNRTIDARAFTHQNRMAVILTQSHAAHASVTLDVPGYEMTEYDGLGSFHISPAHAAINVEIDQHGLAVIILSKKKS